MKNTLLALTLGAFAQTGHPHRAYTEAAALQDAKLIDVRSLDPTLPKQNLEGWFSSNFPGSTVNWIVADTCDLMPSKSVSDYPLCVKVRGGHDQKGFELLIQIGTFKKGIVGNPVSKGSGVFLVCPYSVVGSTDHLSELPALFARAPSHCS